MALFPRLALRGRPLGSCLTSRIAAPQTRCFCSYEASVATKLKDALDARDCVVEDRSGGCGQSFSIRVESEKFRGLTKLKCQRMVQEVIREEIAQWHAVSIQTKVPE